MAHQGVSEEYSALVAAFEQPLNLPEHDYHDVRRVMKPMHGAPLKESTYVEYQSFGAVECAWVAAKGCESSNRIGVFFHGGGFVSCPLNDYLFYAELISEQLHCRVLTADYRLAPENPYPAAEEDCLAVYAELTKHHRITFVMGDSCGGYLGLKTLLEARDKALPLAQAFIGFSGWYDLSGDTHRIDAYKPEADMFITADWYVNRVKDYLMVSERSSHVSAVNKTLGGLPPMFLSAGGNDLCRGAAEFLAVKAGNVGVSVELDIAAEMCHGFQGLINAGIPEAHGPWQRAEQFLTEVVGPRVDAPKVDDLD